MCEGEGREIAARVSVSWAKMEDRKAWSKSKRTHTRKGQRGRGRSQRGGGSSGKARGSTQERGQEKKKSVNVAVRKQPVESTAIAVGGSIIPEERDAISTDFRKLIRAAGETHFEWFTADPSAHTDLLSVDYDRAASLIRCVALPGILEMEECDVKMLHLSSEKDLLFSSSDLKDGSQKAPGAGENTPSGDQSDRSGPCGTEGDRLHRKRGDTRDEQMDVPTESQDVEGSPVHVGGQGDVDGKAEQRIIEGEGTEGSGPEADGDEDDEEDMEEWLDSVL